MIISYSTQDENGEKYAKQLADDLTIYGVRVYADLPNYRPQEFVGNNPWFNAFTRLVPDQDYYILVVTKSFGQSNAMREFETFRNCLNVCQRVCGRSKNNCRLKKIIPCFFIEPKTAPPLVCAISGIREFYTKSYEAGFMELIKNLFPEPQFTSLNISDVGKIINFCKELEELLTDILDYYNHAVEILEREEIAHRFIKLFFNKRMEEIFKKYKEAPDFIKTWLKIGLLKELEKFISKAEEDISKISETPLTTAKKMIIELNKKIKELSKFLEKMEGDI